MRKLLERYRGLVIYGICGVIATLINIVSYCVLAHLVELNYLLANALAWVLAFLFAYYSNSRWVFGYPAFKGEKWTGRFVKFLEARIFTGMLDMALMWLLAGRMVFQDTWCKAGVNVLVIILNYVMSKLYIFKGERQ